MSDESPTPVPKRRWFRFTMRTMFLVMALAACWIGWGARTIRSENFVWLVTFVIVSIFIGTVLGNSVLTWLVVRLRG